MKNGKADVCIIGAGPAGAISAYRLAQKGFDVVVLEAGPWRQKKNKFKLARKFALNVPGGGRILSKLQSEKNPFWTTEYSRDDYENSGLQKYDLNNHRHRCVGGSTAEWGETVPKPYPEDFEMNSRKNIGFDWPIEYEDFEKYLDVAEEQLSVQKSADKGSERVERLFSNPCEKQNIRMSERPYATLPEKEEAYDAEYHANLAEDNGAEIIDNAVVRRLITDNDRVKKVLYSRDNRSCEQEAEQFIIAAGGIETPRLLLLSKSEEHPQGLANSSGLVGKYLMDHPTVSIEGEIDQKKCINGSKISHEYSSKLTTSAQIEFNVEGNKVSVVSMTEMLPKESNYVALSDSKTDKFGDPIPEISYTIGQNSRETMKEALKLSQEILSDIGASITNADSYVSPRIVAHPMGTTMMGENPNKSVVDSRLRTHDIANLSIVSSSVFPTGTRVNPTLIIAALANKAVDHIVEDL